MNTHIQSHHCRFTFRHTALCLLALLAVFAAASPAAAQTYGGHAYGAYINVPTAGVGPLYLSDTGALPPSGDWQGAGSLSENVPAVLSANTLHAFTSGGDGQGSSSASLADIVVFGGQPAQLTASFVLVQASSGGIGSATTEVHDLVFGGIPVTVTGLPNQVVNLPGVATLTINEQTIAADGNSAVVNGLRLTLVTGDEVKLASADSQVNPAGNLLAKATLGSNALCQSPSRRGTFGLSRPQIFPAWVTECIDFVTGGGFFELPNSTRPGRVNFGFNAGPRSAQNPTLKGHLNLVDHYDGTHIKGVTVDGYSTYGGDPDHCRMFEGDAELNGAAGFRYTAGVCDYGEPGRDDRFQLRVTLGGVEVYFADNFDSSKAPFRGELDGGNIQLHRPKCPKPSSSSSSSI